LPPDVIFLRLKCTKNLILAGALPQTLLGELTVLPDPLAGFKGVLLLRDRRSGKGKGRGKEEKGRGRKREKEVALWLFGNGRP